MKRILLVLMAVVLLATVFGFDTGQANAASLITYVDGRYVWGKGIVFVFKADGFKNRDVRGATIFAGSNFHDLGCTVNKEADLIVCVLRGGLTEYAGETGIIYLGGQIFYVTIPDRILPQVAPLICGEFEMIGAEVTFYIDLSNTLTNPISGQIAFSYTFFISGNTLQEVQQLAQEMVDDSAGFFTGFEIISGLQCGEMPA